MKVGIIEVLGAEEVNNILEDEFEKEISTVEIKRYLVPTIDDAVLGARKLFDDGCDFAVIGYALEADEKLSVAFQTSVLLAQAYLGKHIFRVIVPAEEDLKEYSKAAAMEIIRYFYKPSELKSEWQAKPEERTGFEAFSSMFG